MEIRHQICVDTSDASLTIQRFGTREEMVKWIKEVGIHNKITVIITRSDTETCKRGRSNKLILVVIKVKNIRILIVEPKVHPKNVDAHLKSGRLRLKMGLVERLM